MQLTTAKDIQAKFKAGLAIAGENSEGELEWVGTDKQWDLSEIEIEKEVMANDDVF